jgi:hypothetical protein
MFGFADKLAAFSSIWLATWFISSCDGGKDEAAFWKNEREITELTHRAELAGYRLDLLQKGGAAELEKAKRTLSDLEARITYLKSEHANLTHAVGNLDLRNQKLIARARESRRQTAMGMGFATFQTRNGRVYHDVRISEITDSGVKIRHGDGAVGLRYNDLTDDQRRIFGLEEAEALAAEERERREALAYEKKLDLQLEAIRKVRKAAAESEARSSAREREALAALASRPDTEVRPLAQPARPVGSGSLYRSFTSRSPTYRYVYYSPPSSVSYFSTPRSRSNAPFQYASSSQRTPAPCPSPASQ